MNPTQRWKKRTYKKTAKRGRVAATKRGKTKKRRCTLTGEMLHGVPHGRTKREVHLRGRTKKRPSTPFGGVLSGAARAHVVEEAAKVAYGVKDLSAVDYRYKPYIQRVLEKWRKP